MARRSVSEPRARFCHRTNSTVSAAGCCPCRCFRLPYQASLIWSYDHISPDACCRCARVGLLRLPEQRGTGCEHVINQTIGFGVIATQEVIAFGIALNL